MNRGCEKSKRVLTFQLWQKKFLWRLKKWNYLWGTKKKRAEQNKWHCHIQIGSSNYNIRSHDQHCNREQMRGTKWRQHPCCYQTAKKVQTQPYIMTGLLKINLGAARVRQSFRTNRERGQVQRGRSVPFQTNRFHHFPSKKKCRQILPRLQVHWSPWLAMRHTIRPCTSDTCDGLNKPFQVKNRTDGSVPSPFKGKGYCTCWPYLPQNVTTHWQLIITMSESGPRWRHR